MPPKTPSDWLYFTHSPSGRIFLNDLELTGVRNFTIRAESFEPISLTLELFIQPLGEPPHEIKLAIAERLLAKK